MKVLLILLMIYFCPLSGQGYIDPPEITTGDQYHFEIQKKILGIWKYVGDVVVQVEGQEMVEGVDTWHLSLTLELHNWAERVAGRLYYKVDSWVRRDDFTTWSWRQYEEKDGEVKIIRVRIDPEDVQVANFTTITSNETRIDSAVLIRAFSRDYLASIFMIFSLTREDFIPGQDIEFNLLNENKSISYRLRISILEWKHIQINGYNYNCVLLEPLYQESGLFDSDDRTIIWYDPDQELIAQIERGSSKLVIKRN